MELLFRFSDLFREDTERVSRVYLLGTMIINHNLLRETQGELMFGKKKSGKKAESYLKGVKAELKKVSWPSRKEVTSSTLVVLLLVVIFSAFIGGFDFLFTMILKFISA